MDILKVRLDESKAMQFFERQINMGLEMLFCDAPCSWALLDNETSRIMTYSDHQFSVKCYQSKDELVDTLHEMQEDITNIELQFSVDNKLIELGVWNLQQ